MLRRWPIELIVGPPNSGRADAIAGAVPAALDRDPVLVVPTADDVDGVRARPLRPTGATLGGSITTFDAPRRARSPAALAPAPAPELTTSQRQALVRAAIDSRRPGPAAPLGVAARVRAGARPADRRAPGRPARPRRFRGDVGELDDAGYEAELAAFYAALRRTARAQRPRRPRRPRRRGDRGAARGARAPGAGGRCSSTASTTSPAPSSTLIDALAGRGEVTSRSTTPTAARSRRARGWSPRSSELGRRGRRATLPFDPGYTASATLRHLDRDAVRARGPAASRPTTASCCSTRPARAARPRRSASRSPACCAPATSPTTIAIVVRHPDPRGRCSRSVLREHRDPGRARGRRSARGDGVGGSLDRALSRGGRRDRGRRAPRPPARRPALTPGARRLARARIRRGDARRSTRRSRGWERPPRHLAAPARGRRPGAAPAGAWPRSRASSRRPPHRERAPLAGRAGGPARRSRRSSCARGSRPPSCSSELAELGDAARAASHPSSPRRPRRSSARRCRCGAGRPPAACGSSTRIGPVPARARALFCRSSAGGRVPERRAARPAAVRGAPAEIGNPDLRRADPADEERYLFHACVSRPTERLYSELAGLRRGRRRRARARRSSTRSATCSSSTGGARPLRKRGPERAVPTLDGGDHRARSCPGAGARRLGVSASRCSPRRACGGAGADRGDVRRRSATPTCAPARLLPRRYSPSSARAGCSPPTRSRAG